MSENFFQIDKKDTVSKFIDFAKKHSERADDYNPKNAKPVSNHRNYFILDRIRALYHWIIDEAKLDIRRKYIHNDKEYKVGSGEPGPTTARLRQALNDIQWGKSEDKHGWLTKV